MTIQFTDDEIETIKSIISEHGSDCPGTDYEKVLELEYKLGLSIHPTPEEIEDQEKRRKEFAETPLGKQMAEMFPVTNKYTIESMVKQIMIDTIWSNKDFKIGSSLRIRLPTDYNIKE